MCVMGSFLIPFDIFRGGVAVRGFWGPVEAVASPIATFAHVLSQPFQKSCVFNSRAHKKGKRHSQSRITFHARRVVT